jgi:hypothetical protein
LSIIKASNWLDWTESSLFSTIKTIKNLSLPLLFLWSLVVTPIWIYKIVKSYRK